MQLSLLSSTLFISISNRHNHGEILRGKLCGEKPCPDHESIRHHWNIGSPSASGEGSNPSGGISWSDTYRPPIVNIYIHATNKRNIQQILFA